MTNQLLDKIMRKCRSLESRGYFYPLTADEALSHVVIAVERAEEKIANGEKTLCRATGATYLANVAYKAIFAYHRTAVQRARKEYREAQTILTSRVSTATTTLHDLAEKRPAQNVSDRQKARAILEDIYQNLPAHAVRVFRAYCHADGDFRVLAAFLDCSLATAYRQFNQAVALARKVVR